MAGAEVPTSHELDYFLDPSLPHMSVGESSANPTPTSLPEAGGGPGGTADMMLMPQEIMPVSTTTGTGGVPSLLPSAMARGHGHAHVSGVSMDLGNVHHHHAAHVSQSMVGDINGGAGVGVGVGAHVGGVSLEQGLGAPLQHTGVGVDGSVALPGINGDADVQNSQLLHTSALPPTGIMSRGDVGRRVSSDRGVDHIAEGGVHKRGRTALNAEEKAAKDHKRILRNRELARVSNERRKGRIKAMENELQETKATVKRLQDSIRELEKENDGLKSLLDTKH